jgi:hypothetical protein
MAQRFDTSHPPLLLLRPWDDGFIPLATGDRAARSMAAKALAASIATEQVFCAWGMQRGEGVWTGGDGAFGAMLFVDGSALLGESPDGSTLVCAPLAYTWRGVRGCAPQSWLLGELGAARRERLEEAAWTARDRTLWRACASLGEKRTRFETGRKGIAPWKACSARLDEEDHAFLADLLWSLADAAGVDHASLLGATLEQGRIQGPTILIEGASAIHRARIGAAMATTLEQHWGTRWVWRLFAQHWAGRGAPILGLEPPQSGHRRLAAAHRFDDARRWVQSATTPI